MSQYNNENLIEEVIKRRPSLKLYLEGKQSIGEMISNYCTTKANQCLTRDRVAKYCYQKVQKIFNNNELAQKVRNTIYNFSAVSSAVVATIKVILDEVYGDHLSCTESTIQFAKKFDNLITIRSFSKFYGLAGMRIGYMVLSDKLAETYRKFHQPFEPSGFSIYLANLALNDINYRAEKLNYILQSKIKITQIFSNVGISILPTDNRVNIMTVYHPHLNLYRKLKELNIITTSCSSFNITHKEMTDNFIRFRIPGNKTDLQEVINRLQLIT